MEPFEIVANRLKDELRQRGLTQADLADRMRVERPNLTQALKRNFGIDWLFRWAAALNMDPAELVKTGKREPSIEERRLLLVGAILRANEAQLHTLEDAAAGLLPAPSGGEAGAAGSAG